MSKKLDWDRVNNINRAGRCMPIVPVKTKLWFGKYRYSSIEHIIRTDPCYIEWCIKKNIFKIDR